MDVTFGIDSPVFVAVHGGAGRHGTKYEKDIKKALRRFALAQFTIPPRSIQRRYRACTLALEATPTTGSLNGAEIAIRVLEDHELFNAGYGSNLNLAGAVECDAAIMHSAGAFGSVGSVAGMHFQTLRAQHPIYSRNKESYFARTGRSRPQQNTR